jgi:undecaprenyl diphosphate synthase
MATASAPTRCATSPARRARPASRRGERAEILDNAIRLEAIGDVERLPAMVREPLDELRAASAANHGMTLTLALSYGGRESIVRAVRAVVRDALAGALSAGHGDSIGNSIGTPIRDPIDQVDVERFASYLPTARLPPLDLLIRSSGEQRISNFMLWEIAYAELVFVDVLWPEFRREHLHACLEQYAARERRFGLTAGQLGSDVESG